MSRLQLKIKRILISLLCLTYVSAYSQTEQSNGIEAYKIDEQIYADDFSSDLSNWIAEVQEMPGSFVKVLEGKMIADVQGGATIWFKHKLKGNVLIEYERTVIMADGPNDRLSDMNMFWMATDPEDENLFTRDGIFARYHPLLLYYAGIGGNNNTTTRFRRYDGSGQRILHGDYTDETHLLKPNKKYKIQIVVFEGKTEVFVDGDRYFYFKDDAPLTKGYFGFRLVKSHQQMDNFKVFSLK